MIDVKRCPRCSTLKTTLDFFKNSRNKDGLALWCKDCTRIFSAQDHRDHPERTILVAARYRAKKKNLPFNLVLEDIVIPDFCPVSGIKLNKNINRLKDDSPSLDRVIPEKGYVKNNIIIVSQRVNAIKRDALPKELRQIADFYTKLENEQTRNVGC